MTRIIPPIFCVLVVLVIGTYYQGVYSERWSLYDSELLDEFSNRLLASVPLTVGEWEGTEQEYDKEQFEMSNCRACISRLYTNKRTGESVSVYLVSGTARHVTIHTPDWCYVGAGFEMEEKPRNYSIDCGPGIMEPEFATTTFLRNSFAATEHLRILWTFTDNGTWVGPTWAKPHFAGRPALYKLYLIAPIPGRDKDIEKSSARRFAEDFLPALNTGLFPSKTDSGEVAT